ncbi:MAG: M55 family metallopeptidase [Thermoproteota archaeon]
MLVVDMKVYILTDMEGASYVVREQQTDPGNKEYMEACLLLTRDVNAAVEGALEGGASEVLVNDLHGARYGFNLVPEELHEEAKYVTGGPRPCRMAGVDKSFSLAFMIGYHAMAGTEGAVLDHTMATRVIVNAYINEKRVGEIGIDAAILGYFEVPVALVSGCRMAVEEAKTLLGRVETVAVKEGLSRNFAVCLPPARSRKLIREAAKKAVQNAGGFKPFRVSLPVAVRVEYSHPNYADLQCRTPGVERLDSRTIMVRGDDLLDIMRRLGWY